jgi:hypothetical protein
MMDVQDPRFETYERRFMALAEEALVWEGAKPALDQSLYLCLYGDNGLSPDDEFELLERLNTAHLSTEASTHRLWRLDIEADYYQDVILFLAAPVNHA